MSPRASGGSVLRKAATFEVPGSPPHSAGSMAVYCVLAIAKRYGATLPRTPTVAELQADFGMSRATAYRYRAAFDAARGTDSRDPSWARREQKERTP